MMTANEMKKYELAETELDIVAAGGVGIFRSVPTKDQDEAAAQTPGTAQGAPVYRMFR